MSNSTVVQWLNENTLRAYPLTADSTRYFVVGGTTYDLYQIILDAMIASSTVTDPLQIVSIVTYLDEMTITLSDSKTFQYGNITLPYTACTTPVYVRNSNFDLLVLGPAIASIPENTTITFTNVSFEPCVVYEIPATIGVSNINIGEWSGLTSNVGLGEGYQTALIPGTNQIDIEVGKNYGPPLPCGNFISTTIPFDCSSIISSVNGVTANKTGNPIFFTGINHVVVYDDPDDHRLYIGYDFQASDVSTQKMLNPSIIV